VFNTSGNFSAFEVRRPGRGQISGFGLPLTPSPKIRIKKRGKSQPLVLSTNVDINLKTLRDRGKTYELLLEIFSMEKLNNPLFVP